MGNRVTQEVSGAAEQVVGIVNGGVTNSRDTHIHIAPALHIVSSVDTEEWERETLKHAAFQRRVGIDCSRLARRHLERLLIDHDFTAHQLRAAWKARALEYNEGVGRLVAKPSRNEAWLGYVFFLLGSLMVTPTAVMFVIAKTTPLQNVAFFGFFSAYFVALAYVCFSMLVAPYHVARRLARVFDTHGGAS